MIIASGPYVSAHFAATTLRNGWQVVDAGNAVQAGMAAEAAFVEPGKARDEIRKRPGIRLLTNSEDALAWLDSNLPETDHAKAARLFKDKVEFRTFLQPSFPDLRFHEISLEEIPVFSPPAESYPFVIKPAVGFFSIGVRTIHNPQMWEMAKNDIFGEVSDAARHFPSHVLNQNKFVIETYIDGDEFAVDAYYDAKGAAVVLNILEHRFASKDDVSDRLYVSSKSIMESVMHDAEKFLDHINLHLGIRNFPLHAEFRLDRDRRLTPIEINPLRFGGWCTTGDFAHYSWGFNSYEYFMNDLRPNWDAVFAGRETSELSLIVLDNSTGVPLDRIAQFDYQALLRRFSNPVHLSRLNFHRFPLFGFLFVETSAECRQELGWILHTDLREFITVRE